MNDVGRVRSSTCPKLPCGQLRLPAQQHGVQSYSHFGRYCGLANLAARPVILHKSRERLTKCSGYAFWQPQFHPNLGDFKWDLMVQGQGRHIHRTLRQVLQRSCEPFEEPAGRNLRQVVSLSLPHHQDERHGGFQPISLMEYPSLA